ncbi:phosphatidyl inositol kinase [Tulasnella sp. 417]|nr:phosphatidyl inositol kinase [Tulasnella sp. 417]
MPGNGYVRIPQQEDGSATDTEDEAGESPSAHHMRSYSTGSTATSSPPRPRHQRTTSRTSIGKIDLSSLDTAFKRWTQEITQKVRRKKKTLESEGPKEIVFSVFQRVPPNEGLPPAPTKKTLDDEPPKSQHDFDNLANSVKLAVLDGIHPKMIAKGSSGSYFARAKKDGKTQVVGVFKPKDEEPVRRSSPRPEVGAQTLITLSSSMIVRAPEPKNNKMDTPQLFLVCNVALPRPGNALTPPVICTQYSYVSEAAASLLDDRLGLNIVPRTQLVSLSSPAFSYGWVDRANYKKGKALPEKVGSMQTFMNGYKDASAFLRDHPWPGRAISDTYDDKPHRSGTAALKKCSNVLGVMCGRIGEEVDDDDYDHMYDQQQRPEYPVGSFAWTPAMQEEFREELEKLIILDYLMRNTDRGLDNFMIKFCEGKRDSVVNRAPAASPVPQYPAMNHPTPSAYPFTATPSSTLQPPQMTTPRGPSPNGKAPENEPCYLDRPHMHIAAIDNSLSFPHQHPKGWREFTYGWLFLPVSLIGQPFSQNTRDVFLPLLSDPEWWAETTFQLRKLHKVDDGFNERMFQRQMAVMKGQGWNIVQSLKHMDEGPLELTRRTKVLVWDEEVEVPVDATPEEIIDIVSAAQMKPGAIPGDIVAQPTLPRSPITPLSASPGGAASVPNSPQRRKAHSPPPRRSMGMDRRSRSYSIGSRIAEFGKSKSSASSEFPPFAFPKRSRRGSAADPTMRPVPLSSKNLGHGAMMGAATGVSVLEHLEKLDVVESGLNRVIGDGLSPRQPNPTILFEDVEEDDVGESSNAVAGPSGRAAAAEETIEEEEDPAKDEANIDGDIGVAPVTGAKKKPALAVELGSPQKMKRTVTTLSVVGSNGGPTLEQLLGSDDLESGISAGQQPDHIRWASNVGGDGGPVPKVRSATERSFDGMSIASGSSSVRDPLRRTRIVVAEGFNALLGPVLAPPFDMRFVPVSSAYSFELRKAVFKAAYDLQFPSHFLAEGTYAWVSGPTYESPAEGRLLRAAGADVVGMSTVPEVVAAKQAGMDVVVLSLVTNPVVIPETYRSARAEVEAEIAGKAVEEVKEEEVSHEEVLTISKLRGDDMKRLVERVVQLIN